MAGGMVDVPPAMVKRPTLRGVLVTLGFTLLSIVVLATAFALSINPRQPWVVLSELFRTPEVPEATVPAEPTAQNSAIKPLSATSSITYERINSHLVNFDMEVRELAFETYSSAGRMTRYRNGLLITKDIDGTLRWFDLATEALSVLPLKLPENNRSAVPAVADGGRKVEGIIVRYNNVLVISRGSGEMMLVGYTYFNPEKRCLTKRIASIALPDDWMQAGAQSEWSVLYEAQPCIAFLVAGAQLVGHQEGGLLFKETNDTILFTSGDLGYDGYKNKQMLTQEPLSGYGRVNRLHLSDLSVEEVSKGHRNPTGIVRAPNGSVLILEQGPMGGDELNVLVEGGNFGWPYVTLGVNYGDMSKDDKTWPPAQGVAGSHEGYLQPIYSWLPSVATNSLVRIEGLDERLDGDYLVGALAGKSLIRLRLQGNSVQLAETLPIGKRVRDVIVTNGKIYLMLDHRGFAILTVRKSTGDGESLAALPPACLECHSNNALPNLLRVFGAAPASQENVQYSAALRTVGGTWDVDRLARFLADPAEFAPGTTMPDMELELGEATVIAEALRSMQSPVGK